MRTKLAAIAPDTQIDYVSVLSAQPPRKRILRRIALIVGIFLTFIVLRVSLELFGGSNPTARLGESINVEFRDEAATVTVADLHPIEGSSLFPPEGRLFVVTVSIKVTKGDWAVNPLYFSARTTRGDDLRTALFTSETDHLDARLVRAGDTIRGTIAFDVPFGEKIDAIEMRPALGGAVGEWKA